MATFTKVCFYCQQKFEATHSLANICSSDCQKRTFKSRTHESPPKPLNPEFKPPKPQVKLPKTPKPQVKLPKPQVKPPKPEVKPLNPDIKLPTTQVKLDETQVKPTQTQVKPTEANPETSGIDRSCLRCGKAMQDATGLRKYCSRTCRRAMQRKIRKAMIRRVYVEPVSIAVLRQRDEDTCRICGKPVDFTTQPPHPSAATIDHIIALARGGEHSLKNTQLAHLRCNAAKGAS